MSNITQVVNVDKHMTTLKKGVHASDMDQLLSSTGPFTFFAPTDFAFYKLDKGVVEKLLLPENKSSLAQLINHHVVEGKINYIDLKEGEKLKALDGKELIVSVVDGKVSINGAAIQHRDIKATNGVVHFLDTVLQN